MLMEQRGNRSKQDAEEEKYFTVISHITVATSVAVFFSLCSTNCQLNRLSSITIQVIKIVKCAVRCSFSHLQKNLMPFYLLQCESVCC